MKRSLFYTLLLVAFVPAAQAVIRLPSILGNNLVLQRDSTVTLWGWCDPAEKISVAVDWSEHPYQTTGTNGAKWNIQIPTPAAGGPYNITIRGSSTVRLENVLIGEVWLCSGQSNMEWSAAHGLAQAQEEAPRAANARLRLFTVPKATADYPQDDVPGVWNFSTPETMRPFSAVGYYFGRKLAADLGVPIGLIASAWGGTPAEPWTPQSVFANDETLRAVAARAQEYPWRPRGVALCYNAMIHPLTRFRIAGTIWYQGESNVDDYLTYDRLFTGLIRTWREAWQTEFPFFYVQIAPFRYGRKNVAALLREAQSRCESVPGTGMVVVSDLVESVRNIHPADKQGVGERLASLALARTYGRTGLVVMGPRYREMTRDGHALRITFDHSEGGLVSREGPPTWFTIAGKDRKFLPAQARIDGSTVVLWNESVLEPVAARFGFDNEAIPNLFNRQGLPANLFRTDDWPLETSKL